MNYCSHCGSNQLLLTVPAGDNRPRYVCSQCKTIHYQNPRMVVDCLALYQDRILLCRRSIQPGYGCWNLPAGYLENGETVEEGAVRETWEEAQARVQIDRLYTVYNLPHINQVYLHFLAHIEDGHYGVGEESLEVALFGKNEIPWDSLAFSSTRFTLRKYLTSSPLTEKVYISTYCKA